MAKKPVKKMNVRREFWLRPADLAALDIAVVEVFRSGSARTRAAVVVDDAGDIVEECRFDGDVSQDIPLPAGQHFRLAWRVRGSGGDTFGFDVVSRTSGQSLGFDNGTLSTPTDAGQIGFTAR